MVVLATILSVVIILMTYLLHRRILRDQKPSVTDTQAYRKLAVVQMTLYTNPLNYKRRGGKLAATSPPLVLMERTINAKFSDKIPWCLPPTYGDLEMNGAFPSMKTCCLEALCRTMMENSDVFRTEFNANKAEFDDNPEKLGYGSRYGRIVLNDIYAKFPETRKVLNQSADFARTQRFIEYASGNLFSTMFTVLYPGASIRPHFGTTNYRYRIHLCLDIDGVGGIVTPYGTRFWKAGQVFILDDSYLHAGFYEGTRPRVIIMVDIAKPGLTFEHIDSVFRDTEDQFID